MKLNSQTPPGKYRIQVLDRALDVLDSFNYQNRGMSLTELTDRTGLNKTTVKRIASNLVDRGYLQFDSRTKIYQLGLRLFELGGVVHASFSVRGAAGGPMTELRNRTGLTVLLGVNQEDHLIYVDKREGTGVIRISSEIGWRRRLHFGMLGMTLLAHLPRERVARILDRHPLEAYTAASITDRDAFNLRLATIREDGFVVERGEAHEDIIGLAAPVRDHTREVIASLGVALPLSKGGDRKYMTGLIELVRDTTGGISRELGYLGI